MILGIEEDGGVVIEGMDVANGHDKKIS